MFPQEQRNRSKGLFMSEYSKKLLDPRWQKKRLEVLQRDKFTCQSCKDNERTLHVHHCYYEWDKDPWTYNNNTLITLCAICHEYETDNLKDARLDFITTLSSFVLLADDYNELTLSFSHYSHFSGNGDKLFIQDLCSMMQDTEFFTAVRGIHPKYKKGGFNVG